MEASEKDSTVHAETQPHDKTFQKYNPITHLDPKYSGKLNCGCTSFEMKPTKSLWTQPSSIFWAQVCVKMFDDIHMPLVLDILICILQQIYAN